MGIDFFNGLLGQTWSSVTGLLETRSIHRLAVDGSRLGVVYAATDDGVFRFYGGGIPLCLDALAGIDRIQLDSGPCSPPPIAGSIIGDVIVGNLAAVRLAEDHVDLGEVECIIEDADVGVAEIDPPEPPPGEVLFVLVRLNGSSDYGIGEVGRPRLPSLGGCSS